MPNRCSQRNQRIASPKKPSSTTRHNPELGITSNMPHAACSTHMCRLCHLAGGELDQIQFLLGHVSIQTTEHYLGCKQKLRVAVNDKIGIEP
jgi:integrase